MRVLVTGSSGKLSSVTIKHLADYGHIVSGFDISASETTNLIADVRDRDSMLKITQPFDAVIHTAALHGRHMDLNYPREASVDTNVKGTLNLLMPVWPMVLSNFFLPAPHPFTVSLWLITTRLFGLMKSYRYNRAIFTISPSRHARNYVGNFWKRREYRQPYFASEYGYSFENSAFGLKIEDDGITPYNYRFRLYKK
jgi:hypothetical protein